MKNTSNKVLFVLGFFVSLFIIAMVIIFCVKGETPDVLIQYTLGAGGVECLLLALIKVSKVVTDTKKTDIFEEENDGDDNS